MHRNLSTRFCLALVALCLLSGSFAAPSRAEGDASSEAIRQAVAFARDRVYPALVNIAVVSKSYVQGRAQRFPSAGSGVIVSPAGHVVTNFHVAGEAARLTCKLPSGETIDADIVTSDPFTDLCVLRLRLDQRSDTTQPIPFAAIGDSGKLVVGDHVLAMGNPLTLSSSITLGIVSNTSRVFTSFTGDRIESLDLGGHQTGIFNRWIQHDALIQPGNSGGPLVNMRGEVVGINTRGGGGVGFAIPSNTVKKVLNQALTFGEVRRGWLGLSVLPVGKLGRGNGVLISSVLPEGPAAAGGLQPGDVIVQIAGEDVVVQSFEEVPLFYARIADLQQNRNARVVYERGGEVHSVDIMVAPMEKSIGEEDTFDVWGVSAMSITQPMAFARGYPDTKGVVIQTLRPGGAPNTAKPSLSRGDVVVEIAGQPIEDLESFGKAVRKHKSSKALAVRFRRGKRDMITVLDMSKKPRRRGSTELAKAWLGVDTQVLTPKVATALDLEGKRGFRVTRVLPGTEAEKGGIQAGDVITAIDGEELKASDLQDAEILRRRVEDMDIGADAELSVIRNGKEMKLTVSLEETPATAADAKTAEDELLEYKVRELTYMDRVDLELALDYEGLIVANVTLGGWAYVAGLRAGDVLLQVQGEGIKTIAEFKKSVEKLGEERPKSIQIFVKRGRDTTFVFVQPDWPPR